MRAGCALAESQAVAYYLGSAPSTLHRCRFCGLRIRVFKSSVTQASTASTGMTNAFAVGGLIVAISAASCPPFPVPYESLQVYAITAEHSTSDNDRRRRTATIQAHPSLSACRRRPCNHVPFCHCGVGLELTGAFKRQGQQKASQTR
jgi:hypothetical protein